MSPLLYLFFFASGASGLMYEIVWVRLFGLQFGSTVYSAALVTAIFMCGLGLGGWLAGRWADARFGRGPSLPLRAYGVCEIVIAVWALALIPGIPALAGVSAAAASYEVGEHGWLWLDSAGSFVRYGMATLALLPVTLLMGGTLTLLIRHRVREDVGGAGWQVAMLYGVNTAGAALGCLLTDTVLVPELGLRATQLTAVGLNTFAGIGAFALAGRSAVGTESEAVPAEPAPRFSPAVGWASATLALGGFAAMALQIIWFRFLISAYGPYRPVFSLLLTIILLGIWLGSLGAGLAVRRGANPARGYAVVLAGFGLWAAGSLAFPPGDVYARYSELATISSGAWPLYRLVLEGALAMVGVPALFAGATYPLANALVQDRTQAVGTRAGVLYLSNTFGSVLGSLLGGFFLLPWLGMQGSTAVALAAVLLASGSLALAIGPERRDRVFAGICALALAAGFVAWLRLPPAALVDHTLEWWSRGDHRVVAVHEGVSETIAVVEQPQGTLLVTNGFSMAGTTYADQRYMRAFVHVPALLAEPIERVMVMCFGVGGTVSAALAHPQIEQIDVVDLSHDVLEHAEYFADSNGRVLQDPRVRVHVNDARHHLRMSSEPTYDLITGEPPPLPHAGVVNLYTREFFELARARLRPGGVVTYWLPAVQIGEHVTRSVVRAFLDVFPDAFLLDGYRHQLILIGRKDAPLALEPSRLRERLRAAPPVVARDLRLIALDQLAEWVGLLAATPATLARATEGVEALTDDHPALEYGARLLVRDRQLPADLFSVDDAARWCPGCDALPDVERAKIDSYLEVKRVWYRSPAFLAGQPGAPIRFRAPLGLAARQAIVRSVYLQDLLGLLPRPHAQALASAWHGRTAEAVAQLEPLAARQPDQLRLQLELAWMLELAGRGDEAAERVASLRREKPDAVIWPDWDTWNAPGP